MYGITKEDRNFLRLKLENQKKFLDNNFLSVNGEYVPYYKFYFSSWHNSNRYIAELNNRVSSLNEYADKKDLKPIFAVLTLPSEYHSKKIIKLKSGRKKLVYNKKYINDENHSIKAGSSKLQSTVRSIMNSKHFRNIPKDKRCYITTKEPHIDGTCHLNLLVFVPKENIDNCIEAIKSRFLDTHSRVFVDIKNPTAYVMKYIFKTLDDLRKNPELENLTDISFWYLKHRIRRFTMSQTFISLEIYRKLNGRIDLITFTKNYNKGLVTVVIDPETKKPLQIFDEFGELWQKRRVKQPNNDKPIDWKSIKQNIYNNKKEKFILKFNKELHKFMVKNRLIPYEKQPILNMTDFRLVDYYLTKDHSKENVQRLAILENELIKRGFTNVTKNDELLNTNNIEKLKHYFSNKGFIPLEF